MSLVVNVMDIPRLLRSTSDSFLTQNTPALHLCRSIAITEE